MRRQPSVRAGPASRTRPLLQERRVPDPKPFLVRRSLIPDAPRELEKQGVESPHHEEAPMQIHAPTVLAPPHSTSKLDRLGDEIAELSAHLDAATARLLELIRAFDARGGWNTGFRSCAAWLSWRVGLDLGAARERVRVARALGTLPLLAEALGRGELSYAKVRALTRVATPETEARLLTWDGQARPPTSSGSCAAGGAWIGAPRRGRRSAGTRCEPCTCIRPRTAWWSSKGGSSRR